MTECTTLIQISFLESAWGQQSSSGYSQECSEPLRFHFLEKKPVVADFDGGQISSYGGVLLLGKMDKKLRLTERLAACIPDLRNPAKVEHSMGALLAQRVLQVALGYAQADASDYLRYDPLLKIVVGRAPETAGPLASQPTMSRLDNLPDSKALFRMGEELLQTFLDKYQRWEVRHILLDIDSSEDPTYGQQEFTFYNKFYDNHCYLPLFIHASVNFGNQEIPIAAVLRPCNKGNQYGVVGLLRQVIRRLKERFPLAIIHVRGDSGFSFPELYDLLEAEHCDYHIAVGKNPRLLRLIDDQMEGARQLFLQRHEKVIIYGEVMYQADTWSKPRRVVVKLEILPDGKENPRFVVVNQQTGSPSVHYQFYCQRGESENRHKEMKMDLRSDLTSCTRFLANQFRLLIAVAAYLLYRTLREKLAGTALATAQVGTLRQKLILIGARVVESARRVKVYFPTSHPHQMLFRQAARA